MPGVPRATYMPYPFQILQFADRVLILYEYVHASRTVYMDGTPHPKATSISGWATRAAGGRGTPWSST